jgi:hypothetical protein
VSLAKLAPALDVARLAGLLEQLVAVDTQNPPGREAEAAALLASERQDAQTGGYSDRGSAGTDVRFHPTATSTAAIRSDRFTSIPAACFAQIVLKK